VGGRAAQLTLMKMTTPLAEVAMVKVSVPTTTSSRWQVKVLVFVFAFLSSVRVCRGSRKSRSRRGSPTSSKCVTVSLAHREHVNNKQKLQARVATISRCLVRRARAWTERGCLLCRYRYLRCISMYYNSIYSTNAIGSNSQRL
jgi:hypothetical protein